MSTIVIFEDDQYPDMYPLCDFRSIADLLVGGFTIFERIAIITQSLPLVWGRSAVAPNRQTSGNTILINARALITPSHWQRIISEQNQSPTLFHANGQIVAAIVDGQDRDHWYHHITSGQFNVAEWLSNTAYTRLEFPAVRWISHAWDLIRWLDELLIEDLAFRHGYGCIDGICESAVSLYQRDRIYVGPNTHIEDFSRLDATHGPIWISEHCHIESHSRLNGPLYIGPNTQIKGARISSSAIGPHCRVGGEISHSLIQGYSNKGHDGFLGHSIVGQWVNLGAGTTTSNLKNTYGPIRAGQNTDTGLQFLGAIIADHVKAGIGTLFNSGTIVGPCAMLVGSAIHSKWVPPFAFGSAENYVAVRLEDCQRIAASMMARRNVTLSDTTTARLAFLHNTYLTFSP